MADSFNRVYSKPDDFYYGLKPTEELEAFLKSDHPPAGTALDLGCGEGRNSLLLASYGYHVHAIDASSEGIQKLERYARSHGIETIECSVADARTVHFAPNTYEAIVAVTILDHMTKEEGKKVAESLITSLKPGGFVYVEAFTIHDPGAATTRKEGETISETASFVQHYFDEGELAAWFAALKTILYEEIMKYDDSHGLPHYHGLARLIAKKEIADAA